MTIFFFGPTASPNQEYALVTYFSVKKVLRMLSRKRKKKTNLVRALMLTRGPKPNLTSAQTFNSERSVVHAVDVEHDVRRVVCKFHGQMRRQAVNLDDEHVYGMSPTARVERRRHSHLTVKIKEGISKITKSTQKFKK
jgi:hypothetical protein